MRNLIHSRDIESYVEQLNASFTDPKYKLTDLQMIIFKFKLLEKKHVVTQTININKPLTLNYNTSLTGNMNLLGYIYGFYGFLAQKMKTK